MKRAIAPSAVSDRGVDGRCGSAPAPGSGVGARPGSALSPPSWWPPPRLFTKVSSSSYSRTTAGRSPRCSTRRIASIPAATESTS
jgi:hypothetical protein